MEACFGVGPVCFVRHWQRELLLVVDVYDIPPERSVIRRMQQAIITQIQFVQFVYKSHPATPALPLLSLSVPGCRGCPVLCLSQGVSESALRLQALGAQSVCHDVNFNISNLTSSPCIVRRL